MGGKKREARPVGRLPWKSVNVAGDVGFDDDGGLMELEEVDGVNVVYNNGIISFEVDETAPEGPAPKKRKLLSRSNEDGEGILDGYSAFPPESDSEEQPESGDQDEVDDNGEEWAGIQDDQSTDSPAENDDEPAAVTGSLASWDKFNLPPPIHRALASLNFDKPTPVQEQVLMIDARQAGADESEFAGIDVDLTKRKRDIVGVAQTGSGKTLAYGLPILASIYAAESKPDSKLSALILAPTRELALQVRKALADVAWRASDEGKDASRLVSVIALTGGMSVEKQKRQLSRSGGPDIIVATPGRLWDVVQEEQELAQSIKKMRFLVIDEVDRMIEAGHFREMDQILRLTERRRNDDGTVNDFKTAASALDEMDANPEMRTFVFSATMSKELQKNLKRQKRHQKPAVVKDSMSSLDDLLNKVDFRDPEPEIVDLTAEGGLSETLQECKIECLQAEKDVHLYHFLVRYPGRTIVFLSSIDGIRRLHPILVNLELEVYIIHSGMQQRQRLKSMDRFKASTRGILLATDVAARGLDIPSVDHVVHFQLPHSADTYIHRSGRTARAGAPGLALALVSPEEKKSYNLINASLGRAASGSSAVVAELPVDYSILDKLKERVDLAKEIDRETHKMQKQAHEKGWQKKTAEALEIDLDDESDAGSDEDGAPSAGKMSKSQRRKKRSENGKLNAMRANLKQLLDRPLMMRGVSAKYLTTRNSSSFVDQLIDGTSHGALLGVEKKSALESLNKPAKAVRGNKRKA